MSAVAGAPFFPVWPTAGDVDLDHPGSPGVTRRGDVLEFTGELPWVGRHTKPDRAARRVSFGDSPPEEEPPPESWEHYAPDRVIIHGPQSGTRSFTPIEFERLARLGYSVTFFLQNFLISAVFYFVISMLLRIKRVETPPFGSLAILGRCLIPASVFSAVLAVFGTKLASTLSVCVFLVVLAMNALLFVLRPAPAPAEAAFDV